MFLTARWDHVALLSYEVDPALLKPRVPAGTELDDFEGRSLVSLVGFRFLDTRVWGWAIPFHRDFEELNLRFYVRRPTPEGWRRGVVFVKEIVPRRLIAWVARAVYGEPYVALPMRHEVQLPTGGSGGGLVTYGCRSRGRWHTLSISIGREPAYAGTGTLEDFITDHLWGYTRQADGSTREYEVEHPRWRLWRGEHVRLDMDVRQLYGGDFVPFLMGAPVSALVAEGSAVSVRRGVALETGSPA